MKNNYFIQAIILENCPFSIAAEKLLIKHNISRDITYVDSSSKNNYKNDKINTFPQIYLKKKNNPNNLLIGGYTELKLIIDTFKSNRFNKKIVKKYLENCNLSYKSLLRLIQLIN
jgi:glutaredoxin